MKFARKVLKPVVYYLKNPTRLFEKEEINTAHGIRFLTRRENLIERMISEKAVWEPWETQIAKEYIRPGDTVFDIGANIGYFTLLFSKLAGENGQVHAFEPTEYAAERFRSNLDLNKSLKTSIVFNQCGISTTVGTRTESIEARFSARVAAHSISEKIKFVALDDYCRTHDIKRIDFLKIDVDGYDLDALRSGANTIRYHCPLILAELNAPALQKCEGSAYEYISLLKEFGYTSYLSTEEASWKDLEQLLQNIAEFESLSVNILLKKT